MKTQTQTFITNFSMDDIETPFDFEITDIELEVTYSVYGQDKPATFHDPAEYADLEIEGKKVLKVFTSNGEFEPTYEQNDIILALIDDKENNAILEGLLWDEVKMQKAADDQDYAEYRYDMMNDM